MPRTVVSTLVVLTHLVPCEVGTITINSNFTDEEMEAQSGSKFPGVTSPGFELKCLDRMACAPPPRHAASSLKAF